MIGDASTATGASGDTSIPGEGSTGATASIGESPTDPDSALTGSRESSASSTGAVWVSGSAMLAERSGSSKGVAVAGVSFSAATTATSASFDSRDEYP